MRYAVTLRVPLRVCKGGRPLLKPQSSFQFSLPTELKSSRPPSNMAFSKVPAVYGHSESLGAPPSPSNSRSVLLGVALEETPLVLPNTDFSCPNGIVECHIELHSFFHLFSDLHISPDFYGLQDVENYGALLPLVGDLVWMRSLSLRFVSTRQDRRPTNTSCHFTHKEDPPVPASTSQKFAGVKVTVSMGNVAKSYADL